MHDIRYTKKAAGKGFRRLDPKTCWRSSVENPALVADAGCLLLPEFLRLVAELGGLLNQVLLLFGVLLHFGFEPQEEVLVDQGLGVIGLDLERVVDRLDALVDEV